MVSPARGEKVVRVESEIESRRLSETPVTEERNRNCEIRGNKEATVLSAAAELREPLLCEPTCMVQRFCSWALSR